MRRQIYLDIKIEPYKFILFWIVLLFCTYRGIGEEYIIFSFFLLSTIYLVKNNNKIVLRNNNFLICFIIYYAIVTTVGLILGNLSYIDFIQFFMKYIMMPVIAYELVPYDTKKILKSLQVVKNFIFISAIYGGIESVLKYNVLYKIMNIDATKWLISMNNTTRNYQPSSIYLHYSYYGIMLVTGIILCLIIPYRRKLFNFIYFGICMEQLFVAQTRIWWIGLGAVILYHLFSTGKFLVGKIKTKRLKITLAFLGITIIMSSLFPSMIKSLINTVFKRFNVIFIYGFKDGSLGQRLGTLMNWPKYFHQSIFSGLFGTGFQSIDNVYMGQYSYFPGYVTADCQLTIYLVEVGLIGVCILITSIFFFTKNNRLNRDNVLYKFVLYMLILFGIGSITLDVIGTNYVVILLFWVLMIHSKASSLERMKIAKEAL
jgi:hypothetical protein